MKYQRSFRNNTTLIANAYQLSYHVHLPLKNLKIHETSYLSPTWLSDSDSLDIHSSSSWGQLRGYVHSFYCPDVRLSPVHDGRAFAWRSCS